MEDYNKIIESLHTRFVRSSYFDVSQPVCISNFFEFQNTVILVKSGVIHFGDSQETLHAGEVLFMPSGKVTALTMGNGRPAVLSNEEFLAKRDQFIRPKSAGGNAEQVASLITVTFEAKAFDSVNFFASLDIMPFVIKNAAIFNNLITKINQENSSQQLGALRMINIYADELVIEVFRYIVSRGMFIEKLATNSNYFKDPRLISIFNYIKENIAGDLSNKVLANVANVSEDYVGQYFKMLTGMNPQDYIEYQRMERSVHLLRTTKKSIRDIGAEVGYKDTAYFCRRFKMMFGIPAGKMRKRESLMDV